MKRRFLGIACAVAGLLATTGMALAQGNWPTRPITIVSPFAAGGPADGIARVFAAAMERDLGVPVVVTNVAGAGGMLGARQVAGAAPDGHTLLMHHLGLSLAPSLFRDARVDPVEGFTHIGLAVEQPMVLMGSRQVPARDTGQLVQWVRATGERVTMASAGLGSGTHLCAMLFEAATGVRVTTVQYRGSAPAYADVASGRVDLLCDGAGSGIEQSRSGTVNAFLVTGGRRLDGLPETPSAAEARLAPLVGMTIWYGLFGPAGMPQAVTERLTRALQAAGRDPELMARMRSWDTAVFETAKATPAALRDQMSRNVVLWRDTLRAAGVEPQ